MKNNNIEVFRTVFEFLVSDYGFSFTYQIHDNVFGTGQYELKSNFCTFKLIRDRDQCSMLFWPSFCSEVDALSMGWLYDFFLFMEADQFTGAENIQDCTFPDSVDYVVFEKCLEGHHRRILAMKDYLLESNYEWWENARKYVDKRIKNIIKKYER